MTDSLIEMYDRGFEREDIVWIAITRENWLKISDRVTQIRQELSLAEEGLAKYQQENERLRKALQAIAAYDPGQFRPLEDEISIWRLATEALK